MSGTGSGPERPARVSAYDAVADAYAAYVARREQGRQAYYAPESAPFDSPVTNASDDPFNMLSHILAALGDVAGLEALDAGCGEGYLARVLTARGAKVTGLDLAPRLIEMARARDPNGEITYGVADLSQPLPEYAGYFDVVASYLVLNDVEDYRGFAATLASVLKPGGRLVQTLNNPYDAMVRKYVPDYLESGMVHSYRGMGAMGITVHFWHRTVGEYVAAFVEAGLHLTKLAELPEIVSVHSPLTILPPGYRSPRFLLLSFVRP